MIKRVHGDPAVNPSPAGVVDLQKETRQQLASFRKWDGGRSNEMMQRKKIDEERDTYCRPTPPVLPPNHVPPHSTTLVSLDEVNQNVVSCPRRDAWE